MTRLLSLVSIFFSLLASIAFGQTAINFSPANNNTTIETCNGFLIDSGGQGGSGYGNNENIVITLCPDNPDDIINIHFTNFTLNTQSDSGNPQQPNVDYMDIYDGPTTAGTHMGTYQGTQLFNVNIQPTELNPTGCITLRFRSNSVGTGSFGAAVTCSSPCLNPISQAMILDAPRPDSIAVCVGDIVNFADNGSFAQPGFAIASYSWDFMDGTTATGMNASHAFSQPGLYQINLMVRDNNTDVVCLNTNLTQLKVYVSTYPDFSTLPDEVEICIGSSSSITVDPNQLPVEWFGFPGSTIVEDGCITDTQLGVVQQVPLTQTGFAAGTTIQDASDIISICLDMEHTFIGDLLISLTCPNGQTVILHQQGGGGTNLGIPVTSPAVDCNIASTMGIPGNYCWTNDATITWAQSTTGNGTVVNGGLVEGNYAPVNSLAGFVGCPTNGIWTLNITDLWAADDGTVFGFQLNLNPDFYPDDISFTPQIGVGLDSSYFSSPNMGVIGGVVSNNGDQITLTPTTAGEYTLNYQVVNNFGCESTHAINVIVPELAQVNIGNDTTICVGTSLTMAPQITTNVPCTFTLRLMDSASDGWHGNNVTLAGAATGNGNFTVASGAQANYTFTVMPGQAFTVTFNVGGAWVNECSYRILNDQGQIVYQSTGNLTGHNMTHNLSCGQPLQYTWTPAAGFNNPAIGNAIFTPPLGTHNVTLTVNPVGRPECSSEDSRVVTVINPPFAGNDAQVTFCTSAQPVDLFQFITGDPLAGGVWRNPNNQIIQMPFNPATMPQGNYRYTVGQGTCSDFAVVNVTLFNTTINTFEVTNVNCHAADNGSVNATGIGFDYYILTGGNAQQGQVPVSSPFTIEGLAAGDYVIEIHSNDGCSTTREFSITEPAALEITSISADTLICGASDAVLVATSTGGSTQHIYTWINQATNEQVGVGNQIVVSPTVGTTTYCVTLSEECGSPTTQACTNVSVEAPIVPLIQPSVLDGCEPLEVNFRNVSQGDLMTTTVNFGDGNIRVFEGNQSFAHQYMHSGVYTMNVEVVSVLGCVYNNTFPNLITVHPMPVAMFNHSPNPVNMFNTDVNFTDLSAGDIATYQWIFEEGVPAYSSLKNPKVKFPEGTEGIYDVQLVVTTAFGCRDTVVRQVQVVNDVLLYAPNTFTPDGDEFNQTFRVHISGIDMFSFSMQIYNRWGEMIFESFDPAAGWDGTYNGKVVQDGAYTWLIRARDLFTDNKYEFNGTITIIR